MAVSNSLNEIDIYSNAFPAEIHEILKKLRETIKNAAPDAKEIISFGKPVYKLNGILVYFAAYKNYIGFYPTAKGNEAFKNELSAYKWIK